jgi:hypothetical protein
MRQLHVSAALITKCQEKYLLHREKKSSGNKEVYTKRNLVVYCNLVWGQLKGKKD